MIGRAHGRGPHAHEHLVRLRLRRGDLFDIDDLGCFVRPGMQPNDSLLGELGCEKDEQGWVRRDAGGQTTARGVYIAGNAADPRAQVITAAAQGSATAIAVNADLVDEDVATRLAAHRGHRSID